LLGEGSLGDYDGLGIRLGEAIRNTNIWWEITIWNTVMEDNIKIDLRETGSEDEKRVELIQVQWRDLELLTYLLT
jgi:hypothetical protein